MSIWTIIDEIAAVLRSGGVETADRKVDGLLAALTETIADALPTSSQAVLREGARAARRALDAAADVDLASASFAAGQLAAVADVLGFAAGRAADDEALALAQRGPQAALLSELAGGARSNAQLREALGNKTEEYVCRLLRELRDAGLVATQRRGREAFNALTPVGRLLTERRPQEVRESQIQPLIGLAGSNYQLISMPVANDWDDGSALPRLDLATG
jgi:DNA-binding transcriptional ArsR family regulator